MSEKGLSVGMRLGHSVRVFLWLGVSMHILLGLSWLVYENVWNLILRAVLTFLVFLVSVVGGYLLMEKTRGARPMPNTAVLGLWALLHVPWLVLAHHWAEYRIYEKADARRISAADLGAYGESRFLRIGEGSIDTSNSFRSIYTYTSPKTKSNSNPRPRKIEYKIAPLRGVDSRVVGYICYNSDSDARGDFSLDYVLFRPFWTKFNARYPIYIDSLQQKLGLARDGSGEQIFELLDLGAVNASYFANIRLTYFICWAVLGLLALMGPDKD